MLLLLSPALFAASIYMLLGRIILVLHAESHALLKRGWLTKIFVTGDLLSFVMQGAGMFVLESCFRIVIGRVSLSPLTDGGIQSSGSFENMKSGERIIVAGLFIQILFFGFFIITSSAFDYKLKKYPIPRSFDHKIPWRKHPNVLYVTSFLILVRSLFRVAD
jgi:hypothetical protein